MTVSSASSVADISAFAADVLLSQITISVQDMVVELLRRVHTGVSRTVVADRSTLSVAHGQPVHAEKQSISDKNSAVAGDRLATIVMGRKVERGCCGHLGPHWSPSNAYLFTKWHLDPSNRFATVVGMPRSSA